jgi:hypothetical protein
MKKSSVVILTIVAALTISSCAVQKTAENLGPPDPVYAEQVSDTTRNQQVIIQPEPYYYVQVEPYNYYYRSYFWDNLYRACFPHRYHAAISKPGFVPKHIRPVRGEFATTGRSASHSGRRGGFGHHGSTSVAHT